MYVSQIIMLCTLNLYSVIRQLYFSKTGNNHFYTKLWSIMCMMAFCLKEQCHILIKNNAV